MTTLLLYITPPPSIRAISSSVTYAPMYFIGVHNSLLTKTTLAWPMHTCVGLLEAHKPGLLEAQKPGLLEMHKPGPLEVWMLLEMHKLGLLEAWVLLEVHKPGPLEAWVGLKVKEKAKGVPVDTNSNQGYMGAFTNDALFPTAESVLKLIEESSCFIQLRDFLVEKGHFVNELHEVRVEGLETLDYLENVKKRECFTEQGDATTFEEIYLIMPTKFAILGHERKRIFVIRKDGLPDAVVWIPWDEKAKALADFGDDEYKRMLFEKPITLKPGEEWRGRRELSAVPSSYCRGQLDPQKVLMGI